MPFLDKKFQRFIGYELPKMIDEVAASVAKRVTDEVYNFLSDEYDKLWDTAQSTKDKRLHKRQQSIWLGIRPMPIFNVRDKIQISETEPYAYRALIPTKASREEHSKRKIKGDYERNWVTLMSHPYVYSVNGQILTDAFSLQYTSGHRTLLTRSGSKIANSSGVELERQTAKILSGLDEILYPIEKEGRELMERAEKKAKEILPKIATRRLERIARS